MNTWRAGCAETCTSGSEGGSQKPIRRKADRALRPDPYTYINTWEGWLYLATVIDLASRRVVGWATADHMRTDLVAQALTNAVAARRPTGPVIFHSDCGCQYTSTQYARLADQLGVRLSVGRRGQCWDNAVAESFFATIKTELLDRQSWPTRARAHKAIFSWIEGWSGYAGDLGCRPACRARPGIAFLVGCVYGLRSVSGSVTGRRWWRGCQGRASAAGCVLGVGRGSVAAEHGVGVRV